MRESGSQFYPGIEGLRGVAVLVVLLFHADVPGFPGGFLGVSTFFTLSGFLITGLLAREHAARGEIRLGRFWGRRFRRLMPAALATLAAIAVAGAVWGDVVQREMLRGDGLAALFYVANWRLIVTGSDYASLLGSPSAIQHFWSLAIEEQYYVVYPLAMLAMMRATAGNRRAIMLMLAAATVASWGWMYALAGTDVSTARVYFGTDTRCAELLVGGVLSLALAPWASDRSGLASREGPRRLLAAGALACAGIHVVFWGTAGVDAAWLYTWGLPTYALSTVVIMAAAVDSVGPIGRLLDTAPLRWLGRISYGVYLYHWPIFLWLDLDVPAPLEIVVRIAVTLAVAAASYRWFEEPIRRGRYILEWRRFVAPPVAVAVVVMLFVITTATAPTQAVATREHAPMPAGERWRVLVVGDSLGQQVAQGLRSWGERTGRLEVLDATRKGCGIIRGGWGPDAARSSAVCDRWPERVRALLDRFDPELVVVSTAGWDLRDRYLPGEERPRSIGDPEFDAWLRAQIEDAHSILTDRGAAVVWLTTPCVKNKRFGGATGVFDPKRPRIYNIEILPDVVAAHPSSITVADLFSAVCPDGRFTDTLDGIDEFRPDGIHFSPEGVEWVGAWLGEFIVDVEPARDANG